MKNTIRKINEEFVEVVRGQDILKIERERKLPSMNMVEELIFDFQRLMFPGFFGRENMVIAPLESFTGDRFATIHDRLHELITRAFFSKCIDCVKNVGCDEPEKCTLNVLKKMPETYKKIILDVKAGFDGDPASVNNEEVVLCYPGFFATFVYRIAHVLYEEEIPIIPRLMTEYAHQRTGIDIHPGANIGKSFFIDHGTGVVIGETTIIGDNVRIYQGVTLGALSLSDPRSQSGKKRHPTIGNNVIIYANATILGGDTVIPDGAKINGNTFITHTP